jgi:hypothetical protein
MMHNAAWRRGTNRPAWAAKLTLGTCRVDFFSRNSAYVGVIRAYRRIGCESRISAAYSYKYPERCSSAHYEIGGYGFVYWRISHL